MLVLTRRIGETVIIQDNIKVKVLEINGNQVKLGFEAPSEVKIYREEIYNQIIAENKLAASVDKDSAKKVADKLKKKGG